MLMCILNQLHLLTAAEVKRDPRTLLPHVRVPRITPQASGHLEGSRCCVSKVKALHFESVWIIVGLFC